MEKVTFQAKTLNALRRGRYFPGATTVSGPWRAKVEQLPDVEEQLKMEARERPLPTAEEWSYSLPHFPLG